MSRFLSWRVGFLLEVVVIAVVLSSLGLVQEVPYTGGRSVDVLGALLSALGMGGLVIGILVLEKQLAGQPPEIREEIIRINTDARPLALQVALLVPILAGLVGLLTGFRMMRRPDRAPSDAAGMALA